MASAAKKQDMPPPGGYRSIPFLRNPAKSYFNGVTLIAGFVGLTTVGCALWISSSKRLKKHRIEMRSGSLAITPLLLAEKDREMLRQLRRNRDEETILMANVPGWEVGTYYGEKVYTTIPEDTWRDPFAREYYAHASERDFRKRAHFTDWI
ncbi:NADH dehydrogenase [ubiquinone] 1 alpha subcomplex subunit 13 [Neocloeon triangulifer]|uniref:NADH dehydrogenase [ubiquinone] 1 alpha subcomplex subunit 13 n=1 Tax=Neocloeon triangulifer TaxID=2078957 RepID=UPI00286EDB3A|nr:NADH dehydrogenase [ubiquinone] 1 alpha subcomplex subunit 13 [Neocloeon triangulifer]